MDNNARQDAVVLGRNSFETPPARTLMVSLFCGRILPGPTGDEIRRRRRLIESLQRKYAQQQQQNVQEETKARNSKKETKSDQVKLPYDDLLVKIFTLLPADSLFSLQFICKKWFSLINCSTFIASHSQHSETVLISAKLTLLDPGVYAALLPHLPIQENPKSYFHFIDLDHGNDSFIESSVTKLADIRASFNGLVLASMENNKGLILMNPVTRKHTALPLGTVYRIFKESYGIVLSNHAKTYKVVHLFCLGRGRLDCEILSISTRAWTRVEAPASELLQVIGQSSVSVNGSLYWMPKGNSCDHFISLNVDHERFTVEKLPFNCTVKDRLVEIGGSLGFVTNAEINLTQVWILVNADDGSIGNWTKRYSIDLEADNGIPIPICSSRNGKEMMLEYPGHHLYAYNFENGEMKLIHSIDDDDDDDDDEWYQSIEKHYIPHRNTLASWEDTLLKSSESDFLSNP